jgi:APA family basic amino acid/polyamine antiporter
MIGRRPEGSGKVGLVRKLGIFDATMMMMGIVIGSGIYTTTGIIAESAPSAPLILAVWVFGGLLTLTGALTYAELGAAMPHAGGHYVYIREAYGPLPAFLFGWMLFFVGMTGSIAALGVAFAEYVSYFLPWFSTHNHLFTVPLSFFGLSFDYSISTGQLFAAVVILALSTMNIFGVVLGAMVQNVFTVLKIGTLIVFVVLGLTIGQRTPVDWSVNPLGLTPGNLIVGFGLAYIAVSWAFDGWNNINYIAGEIKDPGRNLTFALIAGTGSITLLYALTNLVYIYALPVPAMQGVVRIAEIASTGLFGGAAATIISAAVMVSVFGSLNGTIIVGPRVYYAMADDGLFFRRVAEVHPRWRTPMHSLVFQGVWSALLCLTGTFEQLITMVMFVIILFTILAVVSVFTLRRTRPEMPRPYKTWGYPWVPAIFIVFSTGILLATLFERPVEALAGMGLTAIGIPVYRYWKKKLATAYS